MIRRTLSVLIATIAIVAFAAQPASAAVIVMDDFNDKTVGNLNNQGGGTDGTGAWTSDWTGSTNFNVNSSGTVTGTDGNINRSFSGLGVGDTFYVAVTMQAPGTDTGYVFSIKLFNQTSGAYDREFGLRDTNFQLNSAKPSRPGTVEEFRDTPWRLVLRVEPNYSGTQDRLTLWTDDYSDGTFDKTEASAVTGQQTADYFGDIALETIGIDGAANNNVRTADDLIVATDFDEAANFIPEPASIALFGVGGLLILGRKRR